jgi:hypothetical protein
MEMVDHGVRSAPVAAFRCVPPASASSGVPVLFLCSGQPIRRAGAGNAVSGWLRFALSEGVELHLSDQRPKMTLEERRQMLKRIEELVREIYG